MSAENVGGVSTRTTNGARSVNGAPSLKGCVAIGQMTTVRQATNEYVVTRLKCAH